MAKILLAEPDLEFGRSLESWLKLYMHSVTRFQRGLPARDCLVSLDYELAIFSCEFSDLRGEELLRETVSRRKVPILLIRTNSSPPVERCLDAGAADCLDKPVQRNEFLARVRAILRNSGTAENGVFRVGEVSLDPQRCLVVRRSEKIKLRPKAYALLEFLMRHPNSVFSAEALLRRVWPDEASASLDTVKTHIRMLRKSLMLNENEFLVTVRGHGYMLETGSTADF